MALALVTLLTGCKPSTRVDLHYLSGFVPGSQNIFRPVKIAVPPTTGSAGAGESDFEVGAIYDADGAAQTHLAVRDGLRTFNNALIKGLADAGLVPVALDSNPDDGKPPEGSDFILTSKLEQLEVSKRFEATQTIHGQYFTMKAVARVKYQLKNRDGAEIYSNEISGAESEPPNTVGGEVFLPLETEPAESLSVALSRAVGLLILDPEFRAALPRRPLATAHTSTPTPQPAR